VSGAKSRRKGHDFEREFCRWVRDRFGIEFGRNLKQYGMGQEGDTDPIAGFLPECKNCQARNPSALRRYYNQACEQAKKRGLVPLLLYRIPRQGFRAVMPSEDFRSQPEPWRCDYAFTNDVGEVELERILRKQL
jgi:hypothetical protein